MTVRMHSLATAVFNVHSLGLCGGLSDPHHLASQLLSGGQTYPFLWKPPACLGCGCSAILRGLCESWYWNLPERSGGCVLQNLGKTSFAFPFSFPLRRIVELTMSVRMTLASPLTSQGELPLLRPALVPQPLFLNLELLLWLSLTFLPCAQKQTTCTPFLPYFLTLCFIPRPFLAPVPELSPALYPNN